MSKRPFTRHCLPLYSTLLILAALSGCASGPTTTPKSAPAPSSNASSAESPALIQAPSGLVNEAPVDERFAKWLANFRDTARAAGIDDATLHAALDGVRLRSRAVELDRAQPEFTRALWDYVDAIISPQRITQGQQKLAQFKMESDAASTRYGVPTPVLMAVWGLESNYGSNYGDVPVFDALATLGFEGRREAWAKSELLAALKIVQRKDIDRERMVGSWAGAMGQTQFMPSSYLVYAVDADGDGRRDIWGSMADVLSSTAHFLARSGWRAEETWGTEVQLPASFDPSRADAQLRQPSAQWAAEGVRTMDNTPLPSLADASILQPAGARGPAFIVGSNYRAVLRYNNATSYALTVCLLAQRIGGGPGVQAPWPKDLRPLTRSEVQSMQTALNQRGFDSGKPDGQMGPATRRALQQFQRSVDLPADGYPTSALLMQLLQTP
ncbi:MAG: lytic murein transglycosylase [Aquabacterium sp.]|uniref:lytic murein transglycosylase n=1 Tax=Aquabacterium sp. TaxID=1872578 RepID=UPI0025BAA61A|nr:lytic murein transglycosylase [Aquabacterium sp.]MBI5926176.1 lytic murein transglycosylase [Aquabacterium sp.]